MATAIIRSVAYWSRLSPMLLESTAQYFFKNQKKRMSNALPSFHRNEKFSPCHLQCQHRRQMMCRSLTTASSLIGGSCEQRRKAYINLKPVLSSSRTFNRFFNLSFSSSRELNLEGDDVESSVQKDLSAQTHKQDHAPKSRLPPTFLPTLQALHPNLKISINPYDLTSHGHGESYHPDAPPDAVIYPSSEKEIMDILRLCCREVKDDKDNISSIDGKDLASKKKELNEIIPEVEIVSVIPYGAGTSLEGHLSFLQPSTIDEIVDIPLSLYSNHSISTGNGFNNSNENDTKKVRIRRKGGISIDMALFQSIGDVIPGDLFVKVGAGVTRNTLNAALRHTGLQFMVDPGADCSIGGMVACGASGTAAVKYGTMRENVLALTAVMPPKSILSAKAETSGSAPKNSSTIVRCGTTALKSSAGYNLSSLLTGSEGTLGIVTEVTVKLHPIPAYVIAASCAFDDLHLAAEAVTMIRMMGIPVSRCELLDEMSVRAFNQSLSVISGDCGEKDDGSQSKVEVEVQHTTQSNLQLKQMEPKPMLFLEFAGHSETSVLEDLSAARNICVEEFEGNNFLSASDEMTRQSLWAARHRLYYSAIALRGATSRSSLVTDACVPLSHFADVITATARDVKELGVVGPCFGHAGDGNFHCILPMLDDDSKEYKQKVFQVNSNLIERAMSVGGTCTGEHGVGYGKKKYLKQMYGHAGLAMMGAIKRSLDPWGIMNPGKIVDA